MILWGRAVTVSLFLFWVTVTKNSLMYKYQKMTQMSDNYILHQYKYIKVFII